MAKKAEATKKLRKMIMGKVVKITDEKTVKVRVESKYPHPKYGKIIKSHRSYLAHKSADINVEKDDVVMIGEIKPISKLKTWEIIGKLESNK